MTDNTATMAGAVQETPAPAPESNLETQDVAPAPEDIRAARRRYVPGREGLKEIYERRRRDAAQEAGQPEPLPVEEDPEALAAQEQRDLADELGERGARYHAIAEAQRARQEQSQREYVEPPVEGAEPPPQAASSGTPAAGPPADPDQPFAPPPGMRAIKVNGETRFIPEAEIEKYIGLGLSSQARFEAAARMREEAIRTLHSAPPREPQQPAQTDADLEREAEALIESLQYGGEDAKQKLVAFVSKARSGGADPRAIANEVMTEIGFRENLETFGREFADVVADQDFAEAAARRVNELRVLHLQALGYDPARLRSADAGQITSLFVQEQRRGNAPKDIVVFRTAGQQVRQKFGLSGGTSAPPGSLAERRESKRAAPAGPRPAGGRYVPPAAPPRKTNADVIQDIRASRGFGDAGPPNTRPDAFSHRRRGAR
jgi:hypothetical protein